MRKVPFVPQFNSTECGVCVLAMILYYYGAYHPIYEIRKHLAAYRDGITIRRLINVFEHYGIQAVAYHGTIDNNLEVNLPAIITWENNHYVIIESISHNYILIVDPNVGRIKMTYEEFNKGYSGTIILLSKTECFKKKKRKIQFKNSFSSIMIYYKNSIILLMILSLLAQLFAFTVPITIRYLVDDLYNGIFRFNYMVLFLIAMFLNSIFSYLKMHCITCLGINIDREVSKKLIHKLLAVKYKFYDIKSNSEIIYALDNVTCVKAIYIDSIISCIFDLGLILFILTYLYYANPFFCVIVILVLIPNILLLILTDEPIQIDARLMIKEYEKLHGQQVEIVNSILGIKTTFAEQFIFDKWKKKYSLYYKRSKSYQTKINTFTTTLSTMINLSPIIVLIFAILFVQTGDITTGVIILLYTMTNMLFGAVNSILNSIRNLRDNLISFERIEDIMLYSESLLPTYTKSEISIDGDIAVDNICFKYSEEGEDILKNVSCTIKKNSKVAIIGDSGSGKSTFLKILAGIYEIDSGTLLYNDNCINGDTEASIKKQIGFVAQNVCPMNQSIKEYMLLGLDSVSMEDVEEACKIVNIHDEIMQMPMKYHTVISENGKNISGGQCQRIMLARMVLLEPKVLLLDEATSALDITNERRIIDYFFKKHCTIILVTHKLETINNCDKVLFMKNGTLISKEKYDKEAKIYY